MRGHVLHGVQITKPSENQTWGLEELQYVEAQWPPSPCSFSTFSVSSCLELY